MQTIQKMNWKAKAIVTIYIVQKLCETNIKIINWGPGCGLSSHHQAFQRSWARDWTSNYYSSSRSKDVAAKLEKYAYTPA